MLPPPFFFICGTVDITERYMLLTLTLNTRSNSFSVTSSVGLFLYVVPALLTTMSTRPHFCTQVSIADFQCASFVTSMDWESISEEDEERVVASSLAPDSFRSPIRTLHPSWEKRVEIALPKPDAPPIDLLASYSMYMLREGVMHPLQWQPCLGVVCLSS